MNARETVLHLPTDFSKIPLSMSKDFSPQTALKVRDTRVAFGVARGLEAKLSDNRPGSQIIFMLLDRNRER